MWEKLRPKETPEQERRDIVASILKKVRHGLCSTSLKYAGIILSLWLCVWHTTTQHPTPAR